MSSQLIPLSSDVGDQLLRETAQLSDSCYQPLLHGIFAKHAGTKTCGIFSAVLLANAAHVGQLRPPVASPIPPGHPEVAVSQDQLRFTEESILKSPITKKVISEENVAEGVTLTTVRDLLTAHGYGSTVHLASDRTVADFRQDAVDALSKMDSSSGIIVNYAMSVFGKDICADGLHSPLAAFHKETDRFLILNVSSNCQEGWATAEDLFAAMSAVDGSSGKTRGYCLFSLRCGLEMSSELIDLASDAGAKLLSEAAQVAGSCYQPFIHGVFTKQNSRTACGLVSVALVMNAADLGRSRPPVASPIPAGHPELAVSREQLKFSEQSMLNSPITAGIVSLDSINKQGVTLENVGDLLLGHGYGASVHHASEKTVEEFREDAINALSKMDSSNGIIVNYDMSVLGQGMLNGHHSPLGAYHRDGDRFLVLDTWPDTQECWATTGQLFKAMNATDDVSGKTRGYCLFYIR